MKSATPCRRSITAFYPERSTTVRVLSIASKMLHDWPRREFRLADSRHTSSPNQPAQFESVTNPEEIRLLTSFDALLAEAPELGDDPPDSDVFYSFAWFDNLRQNGFARDAGICLLCVRDRARSESACLPLVAGRDLAGLSNYYSSLFGPIGHVGEQRLWNAAFGHLKHAATRWPVIDLHPLDPDDPFYDAALTGLRSAGYWADSYYCFGNWTLDVGGRSFAEYFGARPSPLRHTVERSRRKLERAGDWSIRIQQGDGQGLETAIADFTHVYARSWKPSESFPEFIAGLCRSAARKGWLRLGILRLGGQPAAAQIWLIKGRKANIFKLAYDEAWKQFSVGSVLSAAMMENAIDHDKVDEVDYLTGDDPYKQDWMSRRRERRGIVAFNPATARGLLMAAIHFAGKTRSRFRRKNADLRRIVCV